MTTSGKGFLGVGSGFVFFLTRRCIPRPSIVTLLRFLADFSPFSPSEPPLVFAVSPPSRAWSAAFASASNAWIGAVNESCGSAESEASESLDDTEDRREREGEGAADESGMIPYVPNWWFWGQHIAMTGDRLQTYWRRKAR